MSRKHEEYRQSIRGQRQAEGFLKRTSAKRAKELFGLGQNQLRILTGLLTGYCHLNRHLFKLGLVHSRCRYKQAISTVLYALCVCKALATVSFRHLCQHFMKPRDFEDITITRILLFVQDAGLLNA
jgi:hypothetical protein